MKDVIEVGDRMVPYKYGNNGRFGYPTLVVVGIIKTRAYLLPESVAARLIAGDLSSPSALRAAAGGRVRTVLLKKTAVSETAVDSYVWEDCVEIAEKFWTETAKILGSSFYRAEARLPPSKLRALVHHASMILKIMESEK